MPRSIRFNFRNRWKESDSAVTAAGEREGYEAVNTQTPALAESWRSAGLPGAYIVCDLGSARDIGAVSLVRCNLTIDGTFRVRVSNSSTFASTLFDTGSRARPRYFSDLEVAAARTSEFFTSGRPSVSFGKMAQRQVINVELPSEVTGRYVRVDFDDAANSDGYIEVGYVYAGKVLQPSNDLLLGWQIQRDQIVRNGQAACGQYWSVPVRSKTLVSLALAPQSDTAVFRDWLLVQNLISINDEFIVSLIDRTDSLNFTTTIFGKFVVVPTTQQSAFRSYIMPMQIEEIVD